MTGQRFIRSAELSSGTTAAGVRHDLRHVLATLQVLLQVADGAGSAPPGQLPHLVSAARREARLALELLESLPHPQEAGSRATAVPAVASPEPGGVCHLDEVLRTAAEVTFRGGRTVKVQTVPSLLVPLPQTAVTRIVRNLLWNALAATADSGAVELHAAPTDVPGLPSAEQRHVRLEVHDDGPGIGAGGTHRAGGAGLSVVRSLVLPVGGWLVMGRSPLGGACAAVTLPAAGATVPA